MLHIVIPIILFFVCRFVGLDLLIQSFNNVVLCFVVGCRNRFDKTGIHKVSFYRMQVVLDTDEEAIWPLSQTSKTVAGTNNRGSIKMSSRVCSDHFVTGTNTSIRNS